MVALRILEQHLTPEYEFNFDRDPELDTGLPTNVIIQNKNNTTYYCQFPLTAKDNLLYFNSYYLEDIFEKLRLSQNMRNEIVDSAKSN